MEEFESRYEVRLPEDYRRFLFELGNGGAGPFYGVFKLGEVDAAHGFRSFEDAGGFIGVLSRPFPHPEAWNDLSGRPDEITDDMEYERALEAFEKRYYRPENVDGSIPICHEGCALRYWLVITGAEAGHVWRDARADNGGLYPVLSPGKRRVTFLEWYCDWLNTAVPKLPGERLSADRRSGPGGV